MLSIQSDVPFEGAYGNLKRLFDKAAKMYHQVKKQEMKKLSPSRQRWAEKKHACLKTCGKTKLIKLFYALFMCFPS